MRFAHIDTLPSLGHGSRALFSSLSDDNTVPAVYLGDDGVPAHMDPKTKTFASVDDLAGALRRAEAAQGEFEERLGRADKNWSNYIVREQTGEKLPQ